MKTLVITFALIIASTLSYAQFPQSFASDSCCYISKELRAAIVDLEGSSVDVKIAKLPNDVIKIRVKDGSDIIHQTRVKKEEIVNLKFDLAQYPEGNYTFEILRKNDMVYSKEINTSTDNYALASK